MDTDTLRSLAQRSDPSLGISERFVQPVLGGGRTVAVVSEPLGRTRPLGLVLCHSYGLEQIYLAGFDVHVARALSAAGFPVLRYHGQGYGDSEGIDDVGLSSHIADATDAVGCLVEQTGVRAVGLLGARLGGTVAAIVADRLQADFVAVVAPATDGRRYMRQLLWSHVVSDWTARGREDLSSRKAQDGANPGPGVADGNGSEAMTLRAVRQALDERGWADVGGFRLTARSCGEIEATSMVEEVRSFAGDALVLGLSRSGEPRPDVLGLARHLESLGANVTTEGLSDPLPDAFGRYNFRTAPGKKVDRLAELNPTLSALIARWFASRSPW
jgi:pimeloyl-ACP methyl ester carboxylesterase